MPGLTQFDKYRLIRITDPTSWLLKVAVLAFCPPSVVSGPLLATRAFTAPMNALLSQFLMMHLHGTMCAVHSAFPTSSWAVLFMALACFGDTMLLVPSPQLCSALSSTTEFPTCSSHSVSHWWLQCPTVDLLASGTTVCVGPSPKTDSASTTAQATSRRQPAGAPGRSVEINEELDVF